MAQVFGFFIAMLALVVSAFAQAPAPAPAPDTGDAFSLTVPGVLVGMGFLVTALTQLRN